MILSYLFDQYKQTRWPFLTTVEIINRFGPEAKDELKQLRKEGYIKRREGINSPLTQLLVDEDGCEIKV